MIMRSINDVSNNDIVIIKILIRIINYADAVFKIYNYVQHYELSHSFL